MERMAFFVRAKVIGSIVHFSEHIKMSVVFFVRSRLRFLFFCFSKSEEEEITVYITKDTKTDHINEKSDKEKVCITSFRRCQNE